ncbi:MAG: TonB-dependent receptor [Filimonas sp.]|nr:TonB-dependent receptor [Filimonas sp.]
MRRLGINMIAWLCVTHICYAQQRDTTHVHVLQEVKVKASTPLTPASPVTPSQVLTGEALQRMNSLSVADAMRYFSGIQLKDYGGIGGLKTVNIRSMGTNHTGVFYDGIQLGNAQNGQVDLGKFSLDNMEQVALYNGQKSTLFQPAKGFANAGSIYMQSRKPHFTGDKQTHVRVQMKAGSFGLLDPSVLFEQKINQRISASVSTEYIYADGKYKFRYTNGVYDTIAIRHNADITALRIEAGLNGNSTSGNTEWNIKAYSYRSERGLPGAIVNNVFSHPQRQWDNNFFLQSSYRNKISRWYQLLLNAKYANDYTRYLDPDSTAMYTDNTYKQKEWYFSAANLFTITPWWQASFAADLQYNTMDADLKYFAYPSRYTTLLALATEVRLRKLTIQGNLLGTFVNEQVKMMTGAGNAQQITPTILAAFEPFDSCGLQLRAFYKRIFRMPTFNDLYYTFIGNTNLKPEYTTQYDVGVSYSKPSSTSRWQSFSIQADAYYNRVTDKIIAIPTANLFRWTMINLGRVDIKGIDVNAVSSWLLQKELGLQTRITYTYQQAQDMTYLGTQFYKDQIPYIPWHSGSAIIGLLYKKEWGLNYSFIYTGERYSQKANIPVNHLEPWYTHDLSLTWKHGIRKTVVQVSAEVNNVFNQYYDVVINYPMPGRNFRFSAAVNF